MRAGQRLHSAVPGDWADEGACAGKGAVMFPDTAEERQAAKAICRPCPVRRECLDFAVANVERDGVWGGLTWNERKHLQLGAKA